MSIKNNFFLDAKKFNELTKPQKIAPSAAYAFSCIVLGFLLLSLALFYFYYFIDGADMMIALDFAIIDSAFSSLGILIQFLVFVLLIHATAKLFGAKKSLSKTFQIHAYAFTPSFLLGWVALFGTTESTFEIIILLLGVFVSLLAVFNGIIGLRSVHKISFLKAFIAEFIVPIVAFFAYGIFIAMYGVKLGLVY
jgi:hypothetical protein